MMLLAKLIAGIFLLLGDLAGRVFGRSEKSSGGARNSAAAKGMALLDEAYARALSEYGNKGFEFWKALVDVEPIAFPHPNDAKKQVRVRPIWDPASELGAGGPIRVLVSLWPATRVGHHLPLRSFLVYPDGTVVRTAHG